jgi:hypothetical protein
MHHSEKVDTASQAARPRARKPARSWGDINLTLNRLVREGVIQGFKTNLSSPDRTAGLSVTITLPSDSAVDPIRDRVSEELEALVEGVVVTVDQQQQAA